jgi:hypothetical protein
MAAAKYAVARRPRQAHRADPGSWQPGCRQRAIIPARASSIRARGCGARAPRGRPLGFGLARGRVGAAGRACGSIYARLSTVPAPAPLPPAPAAPGDRAAAAVLHLDLHPLNILVSGTEITGVLDRANAAAGAPVLDRARSRAILALDPVAQARQAQPGWHALTEGWAESGYPARCPGVGAGLGMPLHAHRPRQPYPPGDLAHVRHALHQSETAAAHPAGD